jgi:serine protease Do
VNGEVVGINTAIIAGGQGIGFATPINMVKEVLSQLKEKGSVTRGWIGVSIQELTLELAQSFGLKEPNGVLVSSVTPGDPAEKAGLKAGDIIVGFNGKTITDLSDLPRTVASTAPGKTVEVKVIRDGKEKSFLIKVGTKVEEGVREKPSEEKELAPDERLGFSAQPITPEIAKRLGLKDAEGVIVSAVKPDSPAGSAGLKRGDVVKEVDRSPVKSMKDYERAISATEKKDVVLLLILRGNNTLYVVLKLK